MPYAYGIEPVENAFVDMGELPEIEKSGLYDLLIEDATYGFKTKDGIDRETFNPLDPATKGDLKSEWVSLSCAVREGGKAVAQVRFSVFLVGAQAGDLAYFLGSRDANGGLYLPDPTIREGISSRTGAAYRFYTFPDMRFKTLHAMLRYQGKTADGKGGVRSVFNLVGLCNAQGLGGAELCHPEIYNGQPRQVYQEFLAECARANQQTAPTPAPAPQVQAAPVQPTPAPVASAGATAPATPAAVKKPAARAVRAPKATAAPASASTIDLAAIQAQAQAAAAAAPAQIDADGIPF